MSLAQLADHPAPFASETAEPFASVRDHALPTLAARCDDDFGIVDIDPSGGSELIRTRAEWETWFVQLLTVAGLTGRFRSIVTIVWKRDGDRWKQAHRRKEARWHASLHRATAPDRAGPRGEPRGASFTATRSATSSCSSTRSIAWPMTRPSS